MKTDDFYSNRLGDDTIRTNLEINRYDSDSRNESRYQCGSKYQCQLKCEGNKVYHQAGYCPDCNMKLISVDESYNRH